MEVVEDGWIKSPLAVGLVYLTAGQVRWHVWSQNDRRNAQRGERVDVVVCISARPVATSRTGSDTDDQVRRVGWHIFISADVEPSTWAVDANGQRLKGANHCMIVQFYTNFYSTSEPTVYAIYL